MSHLTQTLSYVRARFARDEDGATMVEYGLLVALIAIAAIVAIGFLSDGLNGIFGDAASELGVDPDA